MSEEIDHPDQHGEHVRTLYVVYVWLMVLLVLTVMTALLFHAGVFNIVIAMAIAVTKAAMVVWIFMHVKYSGKLVWVFASAAFVWLAIMLVFTLADYVSRDRIPKGVHFDASPAALEQHR
jgi:cytochrome c oxidase subunit 4